MMAKLDDKRQAETEKAKQQGKGQHLKTAYKGNVFGGDLLGGNTQKALSDWQSRRYPNQAPQADVSPRLRKIITVLRFVFFAAMIAWIFYSLKGRI